MRRHRWLLYPAWIALCAAMFLGLSEAEDPSRQRGRMLSNDAAATAVRHLQSADRARFAAYEAVHVAYSGGSEADGPARWVVLCDRVPHTGLRDAVVVELDARDGTLLRMRKPVN